MTDPSSPKPVTLVTFLLDRTWSMLQRLDATLEGFNGYLCGLQAETETDIEFTLIQFDSHGGRTCLEPVCISAPVATVPQLNRLNYQPRGGTPLLQAVAVTIRALEAALTKRDDTPKVVLTIQTDGEENCSDPEYRNWDTVRALVEAKKAEGWEINFMAAGLDGTIQAARMGVSRDTTLSYSDDVVATRSAFTASACNAASYGAGRAKSTAYSSEQRFAAGDVFDGGAGAFQPVATPGLAPNWEKGLRPAVQPMPDPWDVSRRVFAGEQLTAGSNNLSPLTAVDLSHLTGAAQPGLGQINLTKPPAPAPFPTVLDLSKAVFSRPPVARLVPSTPMPPNATVEEMAKRAVVAQHPSELDLTRRR